MTSTGWTYPDIDEISYPDSIELVAYWIENPPTHVLLKNFMGYKNKKSQVKNTPSENELQNIVRAFNGKT